MPRLKKSNARYWVIFKHCEWCSFIHTSIISYQKWNIEEKIIIWKWITSLVTLNRNRSQISNQLWHVIFEALRIAALRPIKVITHVTFRAHLQLSIIWASYCPTAISHRDANLSSGESRRRRSFTHHDWNEAQSVLSFNSRLIHPDKGKMWSRIKVLDMVSKWTNVYPSWKLWRWKSIVECILTSV